MNKIFILLLMVFFHIVDDYYLQGWLASAKQKKWWKENAPQKLYSKDYLVALIMHSFSWAFMIMLPVAYAKRFEIDILFLFIFIINILIHAITDHTKANLFKINLITDQFIHLIQIIITFTLLI